MAARSTTSATISAPLAPEGRPHNRILASLPDDEYALLFPHLERIPLPTRMVLCDVSTPIEYVYFIESGVGSVLSVLSDGGGVETATVGNEGMVAIAAFLGGERSVEHTFMQIPGEGIRMKADVIRRAVRGGTGGELGTLVTVLGRYTQAFLTLAAQTSACNRLHTIRERCARWLLQAHDRVGADEFPLTQQFLAQMLGVRRATVTEAAGALQAAGLIDYSYGRIHIRDRAGLEKAVCECYHIIRHEFERLLTGTSGVRNPLENVQSSQDGESTVTDPQPRGD